MYDLILRDATIVTSRGRVVADVAIEAGRIAYCGPRPPKKAKDEISAMGKFLMPGVIDTAVQFDPLGAPDAWERESRAAVTGGVTTVVTLPGGRSPVIDRASALARATRVESASWCDFGLWGAASGDNADEIRRMTDEGLVLGALATIDSSDELDADLEVLYRLMDCGGVVGVHLGAGGAATKTFVGALEVARRSNRHLHLVSLSTAEELQMLDPVRGDLPITAGVTPHHLFLSVDSIDEEAQSRIHTRPPVRPEHDRRTLWSAVKRGRLDCVASDHHPSTEGVPGSELLFPLMLSAVKYGRLSLELLVSLCSEGPARIFGLERKGRIERGADADLVLFAEGELTKVDEGSLLSGAGWSPYIDREAAPKPDLVIVGGKLVASRGRLLTDKPAGRWVKRG